MPKIFYAVVVITFLVYFLVGAPWAILALLGYTGIKALTGAKPTESVDA